MIAAWESGFGFLQGVKKLVDTFIKAVEGALAPVPQIRDLQHEPFGNESAPVEFVPDEQVAGIQPLGAFIVMNRVARLAARRQPRPSAEKGFRKVGIVGTRPAVPETEDVNGSKHERQRADAEAEPGRARLLPKNSDAQEQPGQNEENVDSLDAPQLAVAAVSGMGVDDRLAHLAIVMVGIPLAWNRASAMTTARPRSRPTTMDILPMPALPERTCQPPWAITMTERNFVMIPSPSDVATSREADCANSMFMSRASPIFQKASFVFGSKMTDP